MKNFFICCFFIFQINNLFGQEKFPKYYIQSGDTIGVIYSIEQAQKIYNKSVMLDLMKGLRHGCDSLVKKYFVIVNQYEQKQLVDKSLIEQYEKSIKEKDLTLLATENKVTNLESDLKKCDEQSSIKDGKIKNDLLIIDELKKQRKWLLGGTVGFGALSLFLLGAVLVN